MYFGGPIVEDEEDSPKGDVQRSMVVHHLMPQITTVIRWRRMAFWICWKGEGVETGLSGMVLMTSRETSSTKVKNA